MTSGQVQWRGGSQFAQVPRACIEAIVETAADVEHVAATTAVAVFTTLALEATRDGRSPAGQALAADMLGMNEAAARRVIRTVLVRAGVATLGGDGSVTLHEPPTQRGDEEAEPAPHGAAPPSHPRQAAREPRRAARAPIHTDVVTESDVAAGQQRLRVVAGTEAADAPSAPTPRDLCDLMADLIAARGSKRPTVTLAWEQDMDKLLRLDHRTPEQVATMLRWLDSNPCRTAVFWRPNIRSPRKLRQQWDVIREQREAERARGAGSRAATATQRAFADSVEQVQAGRFAHLDFGAAAGQQ